MHCKFLVFLLIVFFFSFFSSACEFRFIKRIGAHGKPNPDFIIINIINTNFPLIHHNTSFAFKFLDFTEILLFVFVSSFTSFSPLQL